MKVIITAKNNSLDSTMDLRFGRAAWLAVYDTETGEVEFVENKGDEAQSGAGPKVANKVAGLGAAKVFSGDFGPKAKKVLESNGVVMVMLKDEPVLRNLIKQLK